jgi:regulator of cell morphogenesis and NO signaling
MSYELGVGGAKSGQLKNHYLCRIMHSYFSEKTKMADVVLTDGGLLSVLPSLGIELGFGEKSLARVCAEAEISAPLVVLVCNLHTFDDYTPDPELLESIPIEGIVAYLKNSHRDYLEVRMPHIIEEVLSLPGGEMLATFCEKYRDQVVSHFGYEEQVVFPYIAALLQGQKPSYRIGEYARNHSDIDGALEDLKNIIVKYLPPSSTSLGRPVLQELFAFERDVRKHTLLEETILIPLVERLDEDDEGESVGNGTSVSGVYDPGEAGLSAREGEVLRLLASGLSNKQIADRLFISTHTVISHRKNIMRKTGFKTAQGLTFFALHSGLVSQSDFR